MKDRGTGDLGKVRLSAELLQRAWRSSLASVTAAVDGSVFCITTAIVGVLRLA